MDKITCPNCAHDFDVEDALAAKLEAQLKADYAKKTAEQTQKLQQEKDALSRAKAEFEQKKEQENALFKERLDKSLAEERARLTQTISQKTQQDYAEKIKLLEADSQQKQAQITQLKHHELELLKKENTLRERAENLELDLKKQLAEEQKTIEEKAREKERALYFLKEKEYQKQLDDQKKLVAEMQRKAEQGSMQMQGEVQELALEAMLAQTYPFDSIDEVGKGVRGADCIQTVINDAQQTCGKIVYESKRTKNFGGDWTDKLRQDQINCKADLAVLVTETMPNDLDGFGLKDGVWVCRFSEVKSLSLALRQQLIRLHSVKAAEHNKGDKMELLYSYLTSNEFVENIKRIVENYDNMLHDLTREKKAMMKLWAQREKQIWVVQENIASLFGSIKGIAGNSLATVNVLELPNQKSSSEDTQQNDGLDL